MAGSTAIAEQEIYTMIHRYVRSPRRLLVTATFAILAVSAFGFAAANTMPAVSSAGDGNTDITGFTITNISYTLDTLDPTIIDSVAFDISPSVPATGDVHVEMNGSGTWHSCSTGSTPSCDLSSGSYTVLGASNIQIVAAD